MKRFLILLLVFLFLPNFTQALILIPTAQIIVIKTTDGEDGTFSFNARDTQLSPDYSQDFNIQTENATGTFKVNPVAFSNTSFNLEELVPQGWKLQSVDCSGSGLIGGPTFPFGNQTAQITVQPYSNVSCTFHNVKSTGKVPVLIVPGIMGTEIFKGETKLWADVNRMLATANDRFMDPLSFQDNGNPLDTSLTFGEVLGKPSRFLDYSEQLILDLKAQGYTVDKDLFLFPYDWRQELTYTAIQNDASDPTVSLKEKIDAILNSSGAQKLDIVAHSQGGLVVKKLLVGLPSYRAKVNKLVFVGTPHLGAPKAAKALLYGDSMDVDFLGMGLDPEEIKRIAHNMPSVYELLPSEEYFSHASGYLGKTQTLVPGVEQFRVFGSAETKQELLKQGLNNELINNAEYFHDLDFDNFNFSETGIDTYNIVGCQEPTIGRVFARSNGKYRMDFTAGDGTVPIISSNNVGGTKTYYALRTSHGTMLTGEGTRQQIENIITGNPNAIAANITTVSSECRLDGEEVSVHSPVDLHVYDELNNHFGPNTEGGFDLNIPGIQYETIGEEKFAFLPKGHSYRLVLPATGNGAFDLFTKQIRNGEVNSTAFYSNVPITTQSIGKVFLNDSNTQDLNMDTNGDGTVDEVLPPSAVLDSSQSKDITSPVTTALLTGTQGQAGFYRSNVTVSLDAKDPDVNSNTAETSGVLDTLFKVDNSGEYQKYLGALDISSEGSHTVNFYSTDKAGNTEPIQTLQFVIDKTLPEISMQWSLAAKDLVFTGTDNQADPPQVVNSGSSVSVSDKAGNATTVTFAEKDRKSSLKATLKTLSYNGAPVPLTGNKLLFSWQLSRQNSLSWLSQYAASFKNYNILALYDGKNTKIMGLDKTGIISKTLPGLISLKVSTSKGNLNWNY